MVKLNYIGALIFVSICIGSFVFTEENLSLFFNSKAFLIVTAGTLAATFLSYPFEQIKSAYHVAINAYSNKLQDPDTIIKSLLSLSVKSKYDGILSLEVFEKKISLSFLSNALSMLVDGYHKDEIRDTLLTEIYFFKKRREYNERVFRHMASLSPIFGVAGSIVGLIGMLSGISESEVLISSITVALISTLYGIILGSFVFTPIAENINNRTQKEIMLQMLTVEGVIAIHTEQNNLKLEKKLKSFLTPGARMGKETNIKRILRRYSKMKQTMRESERIQDSELINDVAERNYIQ